tara:strand:+ start:2299 stop:2940 length:642 start_codon:yes stop_codon:yes gene_type:complete
MSFIVTSELTKFLIKLFLSGLFGFILKYVMVKTSHKWLSTYSHSISFVLLPIITCGITSVIKTNIALSLGLVGALSIVRFRNPVKNTLELVMYFALISIGITASVNIIYSLYLTVLLVIVIIIVFVVDKFYSRRGKKIHNLSFEEGNDLFTIEIESNKKLEEIENNNLLINKIFIKEKNFFFYRLTSSNKKDIENINMSISGNDNVLKISLSF